MWMVGKEECRQLLYEAAKESDLILVEGVMGMFDGNPSGADMAEYFGIPVAIIIDAKAMAQTFGAIALGLVTHRPGLEIAGVIANNLGSQRHQDLITESLPESIRLLGSVRRHPDCGLPERHLGLIHPHEVADIDDRLDALGQIMNSAGLTRFPEKIIFSPGHTPIPPRHLQGITIAIARDDAFTFIYAANVKLLEDMGASIRFFSPLCDSALPDVDALWLPGGYPELHQRRLSSNIAMKQAITQFHRSRGKILAECGGMLYLMESLTDVNGDRVEMLGLISGDAIMRDRGGCQGMQTAPLPQGEVRAHAHHRTRCENTAEPIAFGIRARHPAPGEPIYQQDNITASYLHLYFPSNPTAISKLFT